MAPFAAAELRALGAKLLRESDDAVLFEHSGPRREFLRLRRCVAVFSVIGFDLPRPKALLGHAHLSRLTAAVEVVRREAPPGAFDGFRFSAAGSDSPAFRRLAEALAEASGLPERDDGDLLLRIRPGEHGGWEVLVRLTPRPLSAREWRVCNRPGGLNATVAVAAHDMLRTAPNDFYLNLMCGSGTLLIERGLTGRWSRGVGVDIDPEALACAEANVAAAGLQARAELLSADATALPFEAGSFDRLSVDMPWGDAVGRHSDNSELYPRLLTEAARVAATGARMVAITHELRLFEASLARQSGWRAANTVRVFHGGHRPGLYLLERLG